MARNPPRNLERWFGNALMHALRRNDWHVTRRDVWDIDGQWRSPRGGRAAWSVLKDVAIIIAAIQPEPKGHP